MISPYIEREGRRLGLIPGATADFRYSHYCYSRGLGPVEIENPIRPLEPLWQSWVSGFLIAFAIACILFVTV